MLTLNERRRAGRLLHAIADTIDAFRMEFRADATKGTGIDELLGQAQLLILDAASRSTLMGLPDGEQARLAKAIKPTKR
jgi:hypothetical protein